MAKADVGLEIAFAESGNWDHHVNEGGASGQIAGTWPGLDERALVEGRDLAVTTDFRVVFGEVLARHLGATPEGLASVFPRFTARGGLGVV